MRRERFSRGGFSRRNSFFFFLIDPASFCKKWLHHRLEILTKLIITTMSSPSNSLLLFSLKEQQVGARNEPPAWFAPNCSEGKKKKQCSTSSSHGYRLMSQSR